MDVIHQLSVAIGAGVVVRFVRATTLSNRTSRLGQSLPKREVAFCQEQKHKGRRLQAMASHLLHNLNDEDREL